VRLRISVHRIQAGLLDPDAGESAEAGYGAKALADRTALKLNIEGRSIRNSTRTDTRSRSLDHSIQVVRHKSEGDSADGTAKKALSTEDYNKYLAKVYSAGDFKKPRDAIGLAKTQPPDAMNETNPREYSGDRIRT